MAYVTYKNRSSSDYRFTVTSLDDPAIADLKAMLVERNAGIVRYRKISRKLYGAAAIRGQNTQGLRIRPRGPRPHPFAHDTPIENATHFDVYVREYK